MRNFLFLVSLTIATIVSQHAYSQTSGNPLFPGWYADPEISIFKDQYWIYPTYSDRYEKQVFFDAFSSKDLVNWKKHERILDTQQIKWAKKAMWAPCAIELNGKYFLFFSANDIQSAERKGLKPGDNYVPDLGGIGIAIADAPQGPYKDHLGKPLIAQIINGAQPIDQFVFRDKDGSHYIIYGGWGHCNIGKLKADLTGLVNLPDGKSVKEITPEGYVEGPVMFQRQGWYYLMWSEGNWTDSSYRVSYGRSKSIFGPFLKSGTVLKSDPAIATGAGHHSVLNIPGTDEWYVVYHRRPIPNEGRDHRVTCMDKMFFKNDGSIEPVKITFTGVEARLIK